MADYSNDQIDASIFGYDNSGFDGSLPASTGKNDSSSVWGSGILGGLDSVTKSAGNIIGSLKGTNKKTTATPSWIYLAAGGLVLLLVVGVLFRR
jgi:hypothetical protein